jgi:tRNA dimethylallyltransferase
VANSQIKGRILAVIGPTGVGKSNLAFSLAESFDGEIVNADSRQIYKGLDIGTSKPSIEERLSIPHHLFDIIDPDEEFSLFSFLELVQITLQDILRKKKLPILVGGSGQYIWGVLEGWKTPPVPPNTILREELEERARQWGANYLHQQLKRVDPISAEKILPGNVRRVVRALEVFQTIGIPYSFFQKKQGSIYNQLIIGCAPNSRSELLASIDKRIHSMLASGWLEEVKMLKLKGYSFELPSFSTMGYRELSLVLSGELSLDSAIEKIKIAHRRLIRRQGSWFKEGDTRINWITLDPQGINSIWERVEFFRDQP